ncbi:hypothetical protein TD3509T_10033 [Tenacibaculum dicentrarchi]|uniref:Uncharacterized protein n=1 Tax=Tenacibaculum dicentrarchi TaxID=669041 RepID=A0ABM9NXS1_9FLAO|nr:hypothetical protein TD3509T_10033 [Tenacibaculum dicentrarchi]
MIQIKNIDTIIILDTIKNINSTKTSNTQEIIDNIKIVDPIKIINITDKGSNFFLWISTLIAILSIIFIIFDKIKESKVFGKIISKTYSPEGFYNYKTNNNGFKTITGEQYLLKLSLSCYRKSLNFKDVNVYMTYGNETIKGEIIWVNEHNLKLPNKAETKFENFTMKIPPNEFLTFNNVLEIGKTSFYYLSFIVPNKKGEVIYDKMELEFIKPNNKKKKFEIFEIDEKQYLFDESLLTKKLKNNA